MRIECPNCCNTEGLEIEMREAVFYRILPEEQEGAYTFKEKGRETLENSPEIFCPACGETCDVPEEFLSLNKIEYA